MFDLLDWRLYGRVGTIIAVLKICLVMTLGDFFGYPTARHYPLWSGKQTGFSVQF